MTAPRPVDRDLPELLEQIYVGESLPDYRSDILRRTAGLRQRPAWTFPERWLPMRVATATQATLRPVPWRTVGLVVALGLLILAALAISIGAPKPLPQPFGPAANGLFAYEARGGGIVVVEPETGVEREVIKALGGEQQPHWSRDGTRLFFLKADRAGFVPAVVDADGGNLVVAADRLFDLDPDSVAWSPDGRFVAFGARYRSARAVQLFNTTTGEVTILPGDFYGLQLFWRPPDGRQLLFVGAQDGGPGLFTVTVERPTVERLPLPAVVDSELRPQGWTPDGQGVAFVLARSDMEEVTRILDVSTGTVTTVPGAFGQLSNDGTRLAGFVNLADGGQVCVADLAGGPCRPIGDVSHAAEVTHHMGLQWSPDDRWILSIPRGGAPAVLLDPNTGRAERPAWLPPAGGRWQRTALP